MYEDARDEEEGRGSLYEVQPLPEQNDEELDTQSLSTASTTTENPPILPVWLRESSKSFHWRWVPLPLRKAGRAVATWVKGPQPPKQLLFTPLFPHIQEAPVRFLNRFFPKRKQKTCLLLLLYLCWALPWGLVLWHARTSGNIEGYGKPYLIGCDATYWSIHDGCGLNGNECRPFSSSAFAFRCPAGCNNLKLLEPYTVGNQTLNYQPLIIGGPTPDSDELGPYRADSFICQAAIHSGVTTRAAGGCGVVQLTGESHSYYGSQQHGFRSTEFLSTFPKSFSFKRSSSSHSSCPPDARWPVLSITVVALVLLSIFTTSPAVFFFSTFYILIFQVGLVSDPPNLTNMYELFSMLCSRLLPSSFVVFVLYRYCARPLLKHISHPTYSFAKTFLYLPPAFIGALNNYTFALLIPIQRLTPHDIREQPGAKLALGFVITAVVSIVLSQAWFIRSGGLMPRYLKIYCTMGAGVILLLVLPGLRLRIHHYILAILLMPGTAIPIRPSLVYQGLLLGLFINGVARWGFASIVQTPSALGELPSSSGGPHGWWGATSPNITSASVNITLETRNAPQIQTSATGNGNITISLWEPKRMADLGVDGVSVRINDVERWRGYLDEDTEGEFSWHRQGHRGTDISRIPLLAIKSEWTQRDSGHTSKRDIFDGGELNVDEDDEAEDLFFRFAYVKGSSVGMYGGAGVWLKDGGWISPPPPPP